MINICIRTSNRPTGFKNAIASIDAPCKLHVCYDNPEAIKYIKEVVEPDTLIEVQKHSAPFGYNTYLNILQEQCTKGHILHLDDDDTLIAGSIEALRAIVKPGQSYIVPFMRGPYMKPWNSLFQAKSIQSGCIGLPCLILAVEHKEFVQFDDTEEADYKAIRRLSNKVALNWVQLPVVSSPARSYGRME